ncbi:MAG: type II toxin-antitoxin system RelE/ParE family toxin [Caldilineaceae bacterium]|nr:type II toxin-antitoxin system RelE/ParE family toxin [Caldilineaceae bacterium]
MAWKVKHADRLWQWWQRPKENQRDTLPARVELLTVYGPELPYPYFSDIRGSRHGEMRELRVQSGGRPPRVFYAFDPRQTSNLFIGGDKTGNDRFHEQSLPVADALHNEHVEELRKEKLIE